MRAGVYIWVSKDIQQREGESLEMQLARAQELCQQHGWEMLPVYLDVMSGKKDKRPALRRFEADLQAGKFGVVICYKVDRLGRSRRKLHEILELIQSRGIHLVSMTQALDTSTATGRMMLSILVDFAVFEVEQLGERVSDTLLHIAKSGRWTGGRVPFGYRYEVKRKEVDADGCERIVPGRLVVEPLEAEGVRLAFETYRRTSSLMAVARALNEAGFRTRDGIAWSHTSTRILITNPIYGGERAVRRRPTVNGKPTPWASAIAGMEDWLIVSGDHEAIVPPEVTRAIREQFARLRPVNPKARPTYRPWAGLLKCGRCGYSLSAQDAPAHRRRYYACRHHYLSGCDFKPAPIDWLEGEVLEAIGAAIDEASHGRAETIPRAPKRDASLAAKVARKEREIEKLEFRFQHDIVGDDEYLATRKRLVGELEALRIQEVVKVASPLPTLPGTFLATWGALEGQEYQIERRELLHLFVASVLVDNERAIVSMKQFDGVAIPTLEVPRWSDVRRGYVRRGWSRTASCCLDCETTERPHYAHGRCQACYIKAYRHSRKE